MSGDSAAAFLDRVFAHLDELKPDKFSHASWKFENRPTSEAVGMLPGLAIDVQKTVDCIMNVDVYPDNVQYVERNNILESRSDTDFTYVQRMKIPVVGRVQVALNIADRGVQQGFRIVDWTQNDEETEKLPRKEGMRTEYSLGAWLISEDKLLYALSSVPRKKDAGSLKFAIMAKGSDATAGEVLKKNINAMADWSGRS
jgi:hypothetical protein